MNKNFRYITFLLDAHMYLLKQQMPKKNQQHRNISVGNKVIIPKESIECAF